MAEVLGPAMFLSLVVVLIAGFPAAFSLAAVGAAFGVVGVVAGQFKVGFLLAMIWRVQGTLTNDNFVAIPLLVLMGMILERTGIAEDMFHALHRLFGKTPGGLAYSTLVVGAVLSAVTGFVSAAVVALGLIALPPMLRANYDSRLATGTVAAAGTLAQVVPPSLVLIVLGEQLDVSVVDLFRGAFLPSLLLLALYCSFIFVATRRNPGLAPPAGGAETSLTRRSAAAFLAAGPPALIVLAVLFSIFFGVATPSEGGAFGVTASLVLGWAKGRLTLRRLHDAAFAAGILCSCVMFLLLGASFFTLVFRGLEGDLWVESMFKHVPAGAVGFLVVVNLGVFLLAFFLDFFEIALIVLPLIAPIARAAGVDMIWLAVLLAVNLQTSFMHPPFGIALYNLRSVAPRSIRTASIYWGAVPFILIQVFVVAILIAAPGLVLRPSERPINLEQIRIELPPPPE